MEQSVQFYLMMFAIPFTATVIITPLISKLAIINGIVDKPGLHKLHKKSKPLLGGVAIFAVIAVMLLIYFPTDDKLISLVIATLLLVITGLLDDIYNLKPVYKLIGQIGAASFVVLGNVHLYYVILDYFERFYIPNFIVLLLITGWIVLMINAFNLIDGLDGLAAGTAAIIFLAMAVMSIIDGGRFNILGVQLIGLGACLGFLIYNFNPAKIFMGDTGSMLLGFVLATTHLFTIKFPFSAQLVLGSMFIFAYPALDVTFAFYRRICSRSPIFKADQGHIHHILLSMGFTMRKTVLLIYAVNLLFAGLAIILFSLELSSSTLLIIGILTALFVIIIFNRLIKKLSINNE